MPFLGSQPAEVALTTGDLGDNIVDGTKTKDALIGDYSDVTITASDLVMYGDATDSNNTKRDTVQGILDLAGGGKLVQRVNVQTGAVSTGTTTSPEDDTIPQNTEGNEFMTLAITPTNASNILYIDTVAVFSHSDTSSSDMVVALFQDSTAGALASISCGRQLTTNIAKTWGFTHKMTAGTTSSTTFKIRIGADCAGTTTFNGVSGSRKHGGVMASSITITEISA